VANDSVSFSGSIPEYYDKYLGPLLFEEYSIDLANRLQLPKGGALLELAAGTGRATMHIRKLLSNDISMMITDLKEVMLEIAKEKLADAENIDFQGVDATDLPFHNSTYDAIVCQFGIMFFPDKQKSFDEMFRVLKAKGSLTFSVWDSFKYNPMIKLVNDSLLGIFPENPPKFLDIPFGYFDLNKIKDSLLQAGFTDINIAILPKTIRTDNAKNAPIGFIRGNPLSLQIPKLGGDLDQIINTISTQISQEYGDPPIEAPMQAIVFQAHKK